MQQIRVDDVAVVRQGEVARIVAEKKGLDILQTTASGRRIAYVTDSHRTVKRGEFLLVEDLGHQSAPLDAAELSLVVDRNDTGPLLPAVLQGVQPVIGQ